MRKPMLCLMLGAVVGCADGQPPAPATSAAPQASPEDIASAVALVKFHCPGMH
ncbi:MAG: hypothetical protein R3C19_22145 [Planctomycetaceae bacterium]